MKLILHFRLVLALLCGLYLGEDLRGAFPLLECLLLEINSVKHTLLGLKLYTASGLVGAGKDLG